MSKKIFLGGFLICLILVLAGLIVYKALHKKVPADFPTVMPSFELITPNNELFSSDSLAAGKIVLLFYSPDCLFCKHEGRELANHAADFTDSRLLFVTCAHKDSAAVYTLRTGIDTIPHFVSLVDTAHLTIRLFRLRTIPTTLLYDQNRKLIRGFEGEVNAAKLHKTIREYESQEE